MSQNVKGSFASGSSPNPGVVSAGLVIPTGVVSARLNATGLDASNTVSLLKSTNNGQTWTTAAGPYSATQANTAITVAHGEHWVVCCVAQQAGKVIDYSLSVES